MRVPGFGAFFGFANDYVIAIRAGNCTANEQHVVGIAHLNHFQVLGGAADLAHVTRHSHTAHDGAWEKALANRARAPMPSFSAVGGITAGEMMALDHALESPPFGHANGIDVIARGEQICADDFAWFYFFGKIAELANALHADPIGIEFFTMP